MSAKISIIVPVYNVEPYLAPCLDSLRAQTYPNFEAILVDDGSTDGSGAICDAYASADPRFHVVRQSNQGVSAARNAGMKQASGDYLLFV
ncbi:MAG: glycosyltransferase family 2 protein, partial [Fimbriimonadaceae bacterium]